MAQQREILSVHDLKVDQTSLLLPGYNRSLFVSNINVPEQFLDNESLGDIPTRIRDFILTEYHGIASIKFQVCAAYELIHETTGATKYFHGSFTPGGNQSNVILTFREFGPNFINDIKRACNRDSISASLQFFNSDTDWRFDRLLSAIISIQAIVPNSYSRLSQRGLSLLQHGRRTHTRRLVRAFPLP